MSFVKRSRIVSVRVSQDEYRTLDQISRRHGANSVSEFLRQRIINSEPFVSGAKGKSREVAAQIDELKRKVEELSQIVNKSVATQSCEGTISNENDPQIGTLAPRTGNSPLGVPPDSALPRGAS
jgi:mobilization protein NikA